MRSEETARILAVIVSTYPNIKINDGTLVAWHSLIGDLDFQLAAQATKQVLQTQTISCLPAIGTIRQTALEIKQAQQRKMEFDKQQAIERGRTPEQEAKARKTIEQVNKMLKPIEEKTDMEKAING